MHKAILMRIILVGCAVVACCDARTIGRENRAKPQNAFAAIAAEKVKGGFHQYPPFYSNAISPHAIVTRRKVYCAFQNTKGQPQVCAYDISKKKWSGPVRSSEFGLGRDAHGNPSICIDRQGRIHIFYGCHGGRMRYTRSRKPYDINAWQEQPSPTPRATYPQSQLSADGDIYLFYRAGGHMEPWSLRISKDDGQSWSEPQKVVEMRLDPPDRLAAAYCSTHPGSDGKTFHCFWVHKDDNAARVKGDRKHPWRPLKYKGLHEAVYRYNMYYIYRDPEGVWRNVTGDKVQLPVTKALADRKCLVFDSGDEFTNIAYPAVDAKNHPFVRFRYGVGDWKKGGKIVIPWRNKFAHYDYDSHRWRTTDNAPKNWPANVKTILTAEGPVAYGNKSHGHWFIFFQHAPASGDIGSYLYLYNEKTGFATREDGPLRVQ
jgi:hypothetical protein